MTSPRRPMRRVGDLLPGAASALGLAGELQRARAMAAWERLVAELAPAAAGATQLIGFRGDTAMVSAAAPIVAQELLLHRDELLRALSGSPAGRPLRDLRVVTRPHRPGSPVPDPDREGSPPP